MNEPSIIDAHVHLWDLRGTPREASSFVKLFGWNRIFRDWLATKLFPRDAADFFGGPDIVLEDFLPTDYLAGTGDWPVRGFVHVDAGWQGKGPLGPVSETKWLESLEVPQLLAIIGAADLRLGADVDAVLEGHLAASRRFRGVRQLLTHHPAPGVLSAVDSDGVMRDSAWRAGYSRLAAHGLSCEITVYGHQLDDVVDLVRAFPEIPVVLSHAGTPTAYGGTFGGVGASEAEREELADGWRASIARLAELPNVTMKISGLAMPILGWDYHLGAPPDAERVARDIGPIVDFLVDSFGAGRCMFASNFPVDGISLSWSTLYEAFHLTVAGRTDEERRALFAGTAERFYRIGAAHD